MAIQINYTHKVLYTLGKFYFKEDLAKILTSDQLEDINNTIEKVFTIENVYGKIGLITGNKDKIDMTLDFFKDESKTVLISSMPFSIVPDLEGDNFIKQGYKWIKENIYPEAIDILEPNQNI